MNGEMLELDLFFLALFLFDKNSRRAIIYAGGGYCVITA